MPQNNPNAFAAALTTFFAWLIAKLLAHFHVYDFSTAQMLVVAGGLTYAVLWVGGDGVKGAALRVWNGAKSVYVGKNAAAPAPAQTEAPAPDPAPPAG